MKPRRQPEGQISDAIRDALRAEGVELFRNSNGARRGYKHGLGRGTADLVGLLAPHGRWLSLEVKRPGEVPTSEDLARVWGKVGAIAAECAARYGNAPAFQTFARQMRDLEEGERRMLEQAAHLDAVRRLGGFAAYVDSVDSARAAVRRAREGLAQ